MTPADLARQTAIPLELKKDGLQQRQNGDWVLRFVVQAADMDERLTKAAMGTRFQAALVAIGDDELPIPPAAKESNPTAASIPAKSSLATDRPSEKAKRDWRDLQPAQQAGIRCAEPIFIAYLKERHPGEWHETGEAAACVRFICSVHSRVELGTNPKARMLWHQIDTEFQAWKALEHA